MLHEIFGEISFNVGWKAERTICLFGKACPVKVKIQAYLEEDGITKEQENAYLAYIKDEPANLRIIEELLYGYSDSPKTRFEPRTLLFERDGACALLCDDRDEPEEGVAVCLLPEKQVVSQDDYL